MPSRFPGMDPYIEGQRWRDFHHRFITEIADVLMPRLRPRYVAVIEENVYLEHEPDGVSRYIAPDVSLVEEASAYEPMSAGSAAVMTQPVAIPVIMPEEVREAYIAVRFRETQEVVTVIEVLSPGNKRRGSDGQQEYLAKREAVLQSPAHLVEIDLLRGGERLPMAKPLPPARDPLPTILVPLAGNDPDVPLDLQAVFNAVYDRAGYDYSLDYQHGTIPPLNEEEAAWAQGLIDSSTSTTE